MKKNNLFLTTSIIFLILGLALVFINKKYITTLTKLNCTPYNTKTNTTKDSIQIEWFTVDQCSGYVRMRFTTDQDYKPVKPTNNKPTRMHKVSISKQEKDFYFYIVSNNKQFGKTSSEPMKWSGS